MSIADKKLFLAEIEQSLSGILTVMQTSSVMQTMAERLDRFEVEALADMDGVGSLDLLKVYIEAKTVQGLSSGTIDRYERLISRALRKIGVPIRKVTIYHLRSYLMAMKNRGIKDSTVNAEREVLCAFFSWLYRERLIEQDPTANLAPTKHPKVIRKPFSSVEVVQLKESCSNDRDKAIICFLLSTGCRVSEVCALNRDDVDFDSMSIKVYGKGSKERTVFIDDVTVMMLRRYLSQRKDDHKALFAGKGTERLTPIGMRYMLRKLGEKSGVENVHPHRFRRTLATSLIDHGMPIQEVAVILGHDKIDTTMTYVYICNDNVKNAYRKYA